MAPRQNFRKENTINLARDERTAVFIDGQNFYSALKANNITVDYRRLLQYFSEEYDLLRIYYFCHLVDSEAQNPLKPLTDFLAFNGFKVHAKISREHTDENTGKTYLKGTDFSIDMAVTIMELTRNTDIKHIVLCAGDTDYAVLIESLQRSGVKVTVISTQERSEKNFTLVAEQLRRTADQFIEVGDLADEIMRIEVGQAEARVMRRNAAA